MSLTETAFIGALKDMRITKLLIALTASALLVGSIAIAQAQQYKVLNCQDLWYRRVSVLQNAGVCVQIPGGLSTFGNLRCKYATEREASISRDDRTYLTEIREAEIFMRCPGASNDQ
jgi:YARHG domain